VPASRRGIFKSAASGWVSGRRSRHGPENTDDQRDREMIWLELFVCTAILAALVLWFDHKIGL
jgi:hypothetical protein